MMTWAHGRWLGIGSVELASKKPKGARIESWVRPRPMLRCVGRRGVDFVRQGGGTMERKEWTRVAAILVLCGAVGFGCSDSSGNGGSGGDAGSGGAAGTGGTAGSGGSGGEAGTGGAAGEGGAGGTPVPVPRVIVSSGRTVRLLDVTGGELTEVDSAEIPGAGLLLGHQIFGAIQQAGQQRIYVGSANDASTCDDWCWGNGRIDRFTYTRDSITHDGIAYNMNNQAFLDDGISCASGTEDDTGFTGQEGFCAPGGLAFSADGTRFYIDDDELDGVEIFSVNPTTGDLSFIAEGGSTSINGLAANPNGTYLYNGTNVLSIAMDMVTDIEGNDGGNATEFVASGTGVATTDLLITTLDNDTLGAFDLTDPMSPSEVDTTTYNSNEVRFQAHTGDLSRFVVIGRNAVRTVAFDGAEFTDEDEIIAMGMDPVQNRGVAISGENEEYAVVAFFGGGEGDDVIAGGATLYSINTDTGELTSVDEESYAEGASRVVLNVIAE